MFSPIGRTDLSPKLAIQRWRPKFPGVVIGASRQLSDPMTKKESNGAINVTVVSEDCGQEDWEKAFNDGQRKIDLKLKAILISRNEDVTEGGFSSYSVGRGSSSKGPTTKELKSTCVKRLELQDDQVQPIKDKIVKVQEAQSTVVKNSIANGPVENIALDMT